MAVLYKTLRPLSQGLNRYVEPHLLSPDKWVTLQQMRVTRGIVENFPGWSSILASGSVGNYGSLVVSHSTSSGQHLVLGGHNKLYHYDSPTKTLIDISGTLTFNPTLDEKWFPFAYADTLYLTNINDGLLTHAAGASVLLAAGNPPSARSGQILNDHLCIFYTRDINGLHPRRFQWSAEGAPATWIPSVTADAGQVDLNDTPDEGVAFYKLGTVGVAYKLSNVYSVTYIGGNEVFAFKRELSDIGLLGTFALINMDTEHFVMGNRQFYRYRGGSNIDLTWGQEVHNLVYPRLHPTYKNRACGLYIKDTDEFLFFYPTMASTGRNNEAVVYSRRYNSWYGPITISPDICGNGTSGTQIFVANVADIVNTVNIIVDLYPQGTVGSDLNVFIDTTGDVVAFDPTVQTAKGIPITRVLESGDIELGKGAVTVNGQVVELPPGTVVKATVLNLEITTVPGVGTLQIFVGHRMELSQIQVYAGPYAVPVTGGGTYRVPIRATGRWFSVRIILPNSMSVKFAGLQYEFSPVGRR